MSKPDDWNDLSPEEQHEIAVELVKEDRGQYLLALALHMALSVMRRVEGPMRANSDIEDMEMIASLFEDRWPAEMFEVMSRHIVRG